MGNCQAIDAAALVIQHPTGKIERFYWPLTASEVMRMNPDHYVSLIIPLPLSEEDREDDNKTEQRKSVRFTRVKLLRPNDTLSLGHAYRLVTSQEVMKVLKAKKYAKAKKQQKESDEKVQTAELEKQRSSCEIEEGDEEEQQHRSVRKTHHQVMRHERHRMRTGSASAAIIKSKLWRPSLQSIDEVVS